MTPFNAYHYMHCIVHGIYKMADFEQYNNNYLFPYAMHISNVGSCYTEVLQKRCVITTRSQIWYAEQKQNNEKLNGVLTLNSLRSCSRYLIVVLPFIIQCGVLCIRTFCLHTKTILTAANNY